MIPEPDAQSMDARGRWLQAGISL